MHDYDNFEPDRAVASIEAARRLSESLPACIESFRDRMNTPTTARRVQVMHPAMIHSLRNVQDAAPLGFDFARVGRLGMCITGNLAHRRGSGSAGADTWRAQSFKIWQLCA